MEPRFNDDFAARPDLWNWFDPSQPGYNSSNVHNVEWTSWDSCNATQIAWRNWGRQRRVAPHPNLASKQVTDAHSSALFPLAHIVADWYNKLPQQKQYLLAAAKVGWEVDIGLNFYFYPNGNSYRTQPPAADPTDFSKIVQQVRLKHHVTRHMSHATRHTSHVTRHTPHVIHHASHVIFHTPHATHHASYITRHVRVALAGVGRDKVYTSIRKDKGKAALNEIRTGVLPEHVGGLPKADLFHFAK